MKPALFELFPEKKDLKVLALCALTMAVFSVLILKEIRVPLFFTSTPLFLLAMYFFIEWKTPKPEFCLYFLCTYMPFSKQLAFDAGYFPSPFTAALVPSILMILSLCQLPQTREALKRPTPLHLPAVGILVLGVVSVLNGIFWGKGRPVFVVYEFLRIWVVPLVLFFAVYHSVDSKRLAKNMFWIMTLALFFVSLMTMYEFLTAGDVKFDHSRAGGIAGDPNVLAVFLNYVMLVVLGFALTFFRRKEGWIFGGVFLSAVRALIGTFSRGGYLCFALGFSAVCFIRKKRLLIPILAAGVLLFSFPQVLPQSIRARMAATIEKPAAIKKGETVSVEDALDRSNRDRIEIWKGGLRMVQERPFFGFGYTRFVPTVADYWAEKMPFEPHNTFIFIAAEMGIPAALFFIWLLLVSFWQTLLLRIHSRDEFELALSTGLLGAMLSLLLSHLHVIRLDSLAISAYFWILIAIVMRLNHERTALSGSVS